MPPQPSVVEDSCAAYVGCSLSHAWWICSCAMGESMLDSWWICPHQVPHPPTPAPSYPASPRILPNCSSPLVDIQPLHHPLPGSSSQSSPGQPQNLSTSDMGLLRVGGVQGQDISGETCPITAATPQLFNSHVACGPWRGFSTLSNYPSRAGQCYPQLTPVLYFIEVLILNID